MARASIARPTGLSRSTAICPPSSTRNTLARDIPDPRSSGRDFETRRVVSGREDSTRPTTAMPESHTFLMGKHPAALPGELRYCKNHMWCRPGAGGVHQFGFTAYAVRLMQDVYFLEWR